MKTNSVASNDRSQTSRIHERTQRVTALSLALVALTIGGVIGRPLDAQFDDIAYLLPPLPNIEAKFERGDANSDGETDIADALFTLNYLFTTDSPAPKCFDAADANDDGAVDISDPLATLGSLFVGDLTLPPPVGGCGLDPTPDSLFCAPPSPCSSGGCADLEVSGVIVRIRECREDSATIRITADVFNNGSAAYRSSPGQQVLFLYELVAGTTPRVVAEAAFTNLSVGASVEVVYERLWPLPGPPPSHSYKAVLVLDPDILFDENPENDQCPDAGPPSASIGPNEIHEAVLESC